MHNKDTKILGSRNNLWNMGLKYVVELNLEKQLIFIQSEGSKIVQTYSQIWKRAQKILTGLQACGLQPRNTIIFQIDTSQDFAPALWSCIMGGFIPVPVLIAPDYSQPNQALLKLHNIWQQLDCPTILTNAKLASQIHAGLQLYGKKNVKTAIIEEIETHSSDTRLHLLQPDELALLLPSSGTTGKPKLVEISSQTFIYRFFKKSISQNNDSPIQTLLSWFPLESISGLVTILPNRFQKNIYLPAELIICNPLLWLDILSKYRVTHAQTTNFILSLIVEQLKTNPSKDWDFSSVQKIGIGAEPIVAKTARSFLDILSKYNLRPNVLRPAYGMTECGPIAGSREGFSLTKTPDNDRFVEIGKPTRGHSIRIVDQQGSILEEGQIGRIQVTGPSMTSGYYKAPELTRELFTEDGWMNTGDLGFLQDGKLTITGREKETIIINARNFSCHEIELVAEEVEGVEPAYTIACAIRQQDSETDDLAIFFHTIITEDSQLAKLVKQIRGKVAQSLGVNPTYIIPIEKEAIPRTATGKIQRLQLKQRLEAGEFDGLIKQIDELIQQEAEQTFVAPRDELELQLAHIWGKTLDIQPISIEDNFFNLGGHSLLAVHLFSQIEEELHNKIPLATLFQAPTIEQLASVIRKKGWSAQWRSLVPIQPLGSKTPLFCIHALGASVLYYRRLALQLGLERPFYGLQAQGLDGKQPPLTKIEDMAAHYIKEIQTIQPEGPYIVGGSSFGGMVALEVAQLLIAQGQTVALLVVFDTPAPGCFTRIPLNQRLSEHFDNFWKLGANYILKKITGRFQWFKHRIKERNQRNSFKLSHKYTSSLDNIHPNQIVQRANKQAGRKYVPQVYPGKVALFRAIHKSTPEGWQVDPQMGWGKLASGELEVYEVPGGHTSMFREPHVRALAEKLRVSINNALEED
ncbi:non-ribosomal peptide synthetase [Okeania sp. SIO2B3]|uniref:non-ribosomal peptide synthetase n=1 Tax=Okeania sp. SIO2B3 TaxID=2607784 RepID=UPI0013BF54FA|nr:non-ribosomal peptide synthetase [Okeania sp. SIO2B3]NET44741.1 AMP-binding protein [Okeania sp. SIO2B3]